MHEDRTIADIRVEGFKGETERRGAGEFCEVFSDSRQTPSDNSIDYAPVVAYSILSNANYPRLKKHPQTNVSL